jgi:hypothetical protein
MTDSVQLGTVFSSLHRKSPSAMLRQQEDPRSPSVPALGEPSPLWRLFGVLTEFRATAASRHIERFPGLSRRGGANRHLARQRRHCFEMRMRRVRQQRGLDRYGKSERTVPLEGGDWRGVEGELTEMPSEIGPTDCCTHFTSTRRSQDGRYLSS